MTQNSANGLCRLRLGSGAAKLVMKDVSGARHRPSGAFHSLIPPAAIRFLQTTDARSARRAQGTSAPAPRLSSRVHPETFPMNRCAALTVAPALLILGGVACAQTTAPPGPPVQAAPTSPGRPNCTPDARAATPDNR